MDKSVFLREIYSFIEKSKALELIENELTCENIFENSNSYTPEKIILDKIFSTEFKNSKDQGDTLEALVKSLFGRIVLIHNVQITNKDTALGQIDILLVPLRDNIYDVWGLTTEKPKGMIGECKNYSQKKVDRPEIEKTCWRACKGGCLSFFIGFGYTDDAVQEISEFNLGKEFLCTNHKGAYIVPLTLYMLQEIIENNINFCYFIKWAINTSRMITAIANYLQKLE
jgi:hypothetical protein